MIVELHGGAWCRGDRTNDTVINEPLARSGVVVAALDFRMPPDASYPGSLVDISYGIRWLKSRAAEPARPAGPGRDHGRLERRAPGDAARDEAPRPQVRGAPPARRLPRGGRLVRCAVLCWPVIDPLGRYRYAKKLKAGGAPYPEVVDRVLPGHDQYWITEEAMAEGSPTLALERGESVELPPVLYIQGDRDMAHPRPDLDRFVAGYRKAGGSLDLELLAGEAEGYIGRKPASPAVERTISRIIEFVHKQLG